MAGKLAGVVSLQPLTSICPLSFPSIAFDRSPSGNLVTRGLRPGVMGAADDLPNSAVGDTDDPQRLRRPPFPWREVSDSRNCFQHVLDRSFGVQETACFVPTGIFLLEVAP